MECYGDYEVKKKSSDQAQDAQGDLLTNRSHRQQDHNCPGISRYQLPVLCSLLDPEHGALRRGKKEP